MPAITAIKQELQSRLDSDASAIRQWFREEFERTPAVFYSSVDIRHAGYKIAPVDTNLFPAGFNHLSAPSREIAIRSIREYVQRHLPDAHRLLIIPENHTRNQGYLENLGALRYLCEMAGYEVRIGFMPTAEDTADDRQLMLADGTALTQERLLKEGNRLLTHQGYEPDFIIMNNDLTGGAPDILRGVTQMIVPPVGQGWYRRKKSIHFEAYRQVARQFASHFGFDPWLIAAEHEKCGRINFKERSGMECVATAVEKVLRQIRQKYNEYGVTDEPYVYVKADSGTYGMGIMTVRSGAEMMELNKRIRNKMDVIKEGVHTTEVIVQEGVPSIDVMDGAIAEPMVYLIAGHPLGGAYRVNAERDRFANLNAAGMRFVPMCEADASDCMQRTPIALVSQLATLAASREEYGDDYMI